MSDYYIVVCKKHKVYVDLEKWNPSTIPTNDYRYLMQSRFREFNKEHQYCECITYNMCSGYSSDGSEIPDTDTLKEVCRLQRIKY